MPRALMGRAACQIGVKRRTKLTGRTQVMDVLLELSVTTND
jgi:hypothetical protein